MTLGVMFRHKAWSVSCLTNAKAFDNFSCSRSENDTEWIGSLWCSVCRGSSLKYEAWKWIKMGGKLGTLNQNGWLPVGVTIWYPDFVRVSGHDTYAYRMSFMYVHVGGGAWIFNIPALGAHGEVVTWVWCHSDTAMWRYATLIRASPQRASCGRRVVSCVLFSIEIQQS